MTREKAIKHFESYIGNDCYTQAHQDACRMAVDAIRIQQEDNPPLTFDELRRMNEVDVWVAYPPTLGGEQLIMHALVEYDEESENVWLTNNLGGRSIYDDVIEDGAVVYRRKPDESTKPGARTNFDRMKSCTSPEDMALELNTGSRHFCPRYYGIEPKECKPICRDCIADWLKRRKNNDATNSD